MQNKDTIMGNTRSTLQGVTSYKSPPGKRNRINSHSYESLVSRMYPLSIQYGSRTIQQVETPSHKFASFVLPANASAIDRDVNNKLLESVRESKFEFLSEAAEAKETVESIGAVATRVYKAAQAVRRKQYIIALRHLGVQLRSPEDLLKTPSDFWLAYQFGIKPLINTVNSMSETLQEGLVPQPTKATAQGSHTWYSSVKYFQGYITYRADIHDSYSVKAGTSFTFGNPHARFMNDYGFDNPLTALWNIIPYSFLIDYFLPVGDWLDMNYSTISPSFNMGYKTVIRKRTVSVYCTGVTSDAPMYRDTVSGALYPLFNPRGGVVSTHTYIKFDRVPNSPTYSLEPTANPFSMAHSLNILALLFAQLRS